MFFNNVLTVLDIGCLADVCFKIQIFLVISVLLVFMNPCKANNSAVNYCWPGLIFIFLSQDKDKENKTSANVMRELRIRKLCLNICVGESGDRLTRAAKVLEQLTGQTPVFSKGKVWDLKKICHFVRVGTPVDSCERGICKIRKSLQHRKLKHNI